jgi:hypothetical protein
VVSVLAMLTASGVALSIPFVASDAITAISIRADATNVKIYSAGDHAGKSGFAVIEYTY